MRIAMITVLSAALMSPLIGGCTTAHEESQSTNPFTGTKTTKDETTTVNPVNGQSQTTDTVNKSNPNTGSSSSSTETK